MMQGKIALEEHFAIPETLSHSAGFFPDSVWPELSGRLLDIHEKRLRLMDEHGIELMLLSLNAPGIQSDPGSRAGERARAPRSPRSWRGRSRYSAGSAHG